MLIGSHVSFSKDQLLGSVKEALSYGANTFMFYTGAPQNTMRSSINDFNTLEAYKLMKENGMKLEDVVCHAPYVINLANNKEPDKYRFSIDFLIKEIERCEMLGVTKIVLHPGSSVGIEKSAALKNIIYALNMVLETTEKVSILLETMAGKGSEIGSNIDELQTIIEGINKQDLIGVCLDTCHLNDSGVNLENFDEYLKEFEEKIGLKKIKAIHLNDSKNDVGTHKDRHEVIGFGNIGFDLIHKIVTDERFMEIPKILETPYIGDDDESKDRKYPPYKFEIKMLKQGKYDPELKNKIRNCYK